MAPSRVGMRTAELCSSTADLEEAKGKQIEKLPGKRQSWRLKLGVEGSHLHLRHRSSKAL